MHSEGPYQRSGTEKIIVANRLYLQKTVVKAIINTE